MWSFLWPDTQDGEKVLGITERIDVWAKWAQTVHHLSEGVWISAAD